nr:hypothetical protein [Tanacetum cinerariifolium]
MSPLITCSDALNPCFNVSGVELSIESISTDLEFFDDGFATKAKQLFNDSLEEILDEEVQQSGATSISDEEIALDEAASEARSNGSSFGGKELSEIGFRNLKQPKWADLEIALPKILKKLKRLRRRYVVRSPPVNCIPVKKFWVSDVESVGSNDPVNNDAADDDEEVESERKRSVEDLEKKRQQIGRNTVDLRSQLLGFRYILD